MEGWARRKSKVYNKRTERVHHSAGRIRKGNSKARPQTPEVGQVKLGGREEGRGVFFSISILTIKIFFLLLNKG